MLKAHAKRTIIFGIIGAILALIFAKVSKPIFESRLEILLGDQTRQAQTGAGLYTQDVQNILNRDSASTLTTERQLLSSQAIFFQSVMAVAGDTGQSQLPDQWVDLYRMYDIETARTTNQQVDAGVAMLKVRAYSAETAAAIANQIARQYNETRQRNSRESVQSALNYLDGSLKSAEKDLKDKERALSEYQKSQNIADMVKLAADETSTQTLLQQRVQQLRAALDNSEARVTALSNKLAATPKDQQQQSVDQRNPMIGVYENQLATLKTQRAALLGTYLEDSIEVRNINEQIAKVQSMLEAERKTQSQYAQTSRGPNPVYSSMDQQVATAKAERDGLRAELNKTEQNLAEQKAVVGALPTAQANYQQLVREYSLVDERYKRLKSMADDLRNRSETALRAALVLNSAQADPDPIAPDLKKFLMVGTVAGLAFGLLLSFMIESLKLRIQSSTQLTALTGLPVIASIPAGQRTGAKALRELGKAGANPPEAFRYMAFSMVTNNSKAMRTFLFTGIKTAMTTYSSAVQFAVAISRGGQRVLLVDADMFQSPISKALGAADRPGLSNLLTADNAQKVEDLVVPTVHDNLMLLPGGTEAATRFLTNTPQPKLEAIMQAVRLYCDVVVVAVPPCDVLADASCVARLVDDVILVVSAAQTNYRMVPLAQDLLMKAGAKAISIVMADAQSDEEPFATKSAYIRRA